MKLVVFDLDGTLTETCTLDEVCFANTMLAAFGIQDFDTNWQCYDHVTDCGVMAEGFENHFGRAPTAAEFRRFERVLSTKLSAAIAGSAPVRPIAGARRLINSMREDSRLRVAIATGSLKIVATLKIRASRMGLDGIPLATADDAFSRAEIVQVAVRKARDQHQDEPFERVVCIGDGVWDLETARSLGYGFIGVGWGTRADELRAAGCEHIVEDYRDLDHFMSLLEDAV